jgi:mono/diheme cytochrome c family protein
VLLAVAAATVLSGCRQDMHNQPKFIPLRSSEFYPDQRSARYPIPGTVPRLEDAAVDREQLDPNSYFLSGKHGSVFGNDLPANMKLDKSLLLRGQDRYNIYCTPCHSKVGDGNGMIVQRGFKHPPTFHQARLRNAPIGHFYDVIANGLGAMPDYATQIHPEDRWAIAVYIRVLQRSQAAKESDVAAEDRSKLSEPPGGIRIPDSSYISPTAVPAAPKTEVKPESKPEGGVK